MDKQKQIEEMAKDLKEENFYALVNKTSYMRSAENLYELGYRKIPEDAVILTETERVTMCVEQYDKGYNRGRKEMVGKFVKMLKAKARWMRDHEGDYTAVEIYDIEEIAKEIMEGKV